MLILWEGLVQQAAIVSNISEMVSFLPVEAMAETVPLSNVGSVYSIETRGGLCPLITLLPENISMKKELTLN